LLHWRANWARTFPQNSARYDHRRHIGRQVRDADLSHTALKALKTRSEPHAASNNQ
jgi:hypothetical protein